MKKSAVEQPTNTQIADVLERIAEVLDVQDANPFRIRAYQQGADTVRYHELPVADMVRQNQWEAIKSLPNIGEGIAAVIGEYVSTGQSNLLRELEAQAGPEAVFVQVPGIGKELAQRIVEQIHVKTLTELEEAAHDGRLATVEGFGRRRVEGVRTALAGMLSQSLRARQQRNGNTQAEDERPSVALLLEIDEEYRKRAKDDDLHKISPRRFNPDNEAWLPVMHVKRQGWSFTVLYSNTARAHELDKTQDWVVIYYERGNNEEQQNTVVTETQGPLKDKRVVRGRTGESREYYSLE